MIFEQLSILALGLGSILFVYWFFFGKQEVKTTVSGTNISIKVDAGYSPSTIAVTKGKTVTLNITRTDPSDCLDQLVIPEWNIVHALPLNKTTEITLTPQETGEFPFHCGMNMFHGKIIVKA